MWHAQVTSLTLRRYAGDAERGFAAQVPFDAVAQVELLGDGVAFIHAAMGANGRRMSVTDWAELGALLHSRYGVRQLWAERGGKHVAFDLDKINNRPQHDQPPQDPVQARTDARQGP